MALFRYPKYTYILIWPNFLGPKMRGERDFTVYAPYMEDVSK